MKINNLILTAIVIAVTACDDCTKPDEEPSEEPIMKHETIHESVFGVGSYTMVLPSCADWIFEIDSSEQGFSATLFGYKPYESDPCDFASYTLAHNDGDLQVLDFYTEINRHGNWIAPQSNPDGHSLDRFKGQGPKFIAYKYTFSGEHYFTNLGWIRIEYSASGDRLRIMDMALCIEDDQPIIRAIKYLAETTSFC